MANQVNPATIPQLLSATVARVGAQPALAAISAGQLAWRSWAEIDADVRRCADRLRQENVGEGNRVAQWAPNSYGWIITDLALLSLGAVHVPLHVSLAERQAAELLELAAASLLVVDDTCGNAVRLAQAAQLPLVRHASLAANQATLSLPTHVEPGQLATLLFTSGTTGKPRGVMLSHENLVSNAIATTAAVGSTANETRLCFLPLSHIYARTCDLYSWLYHGSRLVLAEASAEEQIGRFTLVSRNFSVEQGELTAKLSLRRETILIHFAREIEQMFAG